MHYRRIVIKCQGKVIDFLENDHKLYEKRKNKAGYDEIVNRNDQINVLDQRKINFSAKTRLNLQKTIDIFEMP